jgi:hypothetical protein
VGRGQGVGQTEITPLVSALTLKRDKK